MQPDALFQTISTAFAELGASEPQAISRSLLLREGFFVGHRFRCGELQAIWSPDSGVVEFFDPDGEPLRSVSLEQEEIRKAA